MSLLLNRFKKTRDYSKQICSPLEVEDYVVQPYADVSPPKWHLAHTSWFFDKFILHQHSKNRKVREHYDLLFNSYYKNVGEHWLRPNRGSLSRPTVEEVYEYRDEVSSEVEKLLKNNNDNSKINELVEIGIQHEQQHQELLYMDIKAILSQYPGNIVYRPLLDQSNKIKKVKEHWVEIPTGLHHVGAEEKVFSYDNEKPRHEIKLHGAKLNSRLVTNAEYLEFIEDGGYETPSHWLSLGWDWVQRESISSPLYWRKKDNIWREYTLYGELDLVPYWPVSHISFFEACAFANWKGMRLPKEFELELLIKDCHSNSFLGSYHAKDANCVTHQLWNWSSDQYIPYPGYKNYAGALEEYNRKFMCNQIVLRGGSFATPEGHFRPTYRNFFEPWQRWMFSGIRLAEDL